VVGEAARLIRATLVLAVSSLAAAIAAAAPQTWSVEGTCRDGQPQGPYELRSGDGQLRVAGAFNEGRRTGSFIFWAEDGARAAHVPYDNGVRNGTLALWYPGPPGREPARRFESVWHHGSRDGEMRSWYADGQRRSDADYAAGRLVSAIGWTDTGARLGDAAARELAEHEAASADAIYGELDTLIRDHLPRCD
jgi:hypothetical protein